MSKAFEYKIVTGTAEDVESGVKELTQAGWFFHGALLMNPARAGYHETFAQAMIREYKAPAEGGYY